MFRSLTNTSHPSGLGTTATIKNMYSKMNWTSIIMYTVLVVGLIVFLYYLYKQFSNKTSYNANREHMQTGSQSNSNSNSNKQAELILFYVDWCPHCKTAKPEWEKLKSEYDNKQINGYTVIFTEYNCTNESPEVEDLMNKYKIEGYPTVKLLKDNQVIEYDAKPTKATMEQFLNTVL